MESILTQVTVNEVVCDAIIRYWLLPKKDNNQYVWHDEKKGLAIYKAQLRDIIVYVPHNVKKQTFNKLVFSGSSFPHLQKEIEGLEKIQEIDILYE